MNLYVGSARVLQPCQIEKDEANEHMNEHLNEQE